MKVAAYVFVSNFSVVATAAVVVGGAPAIFFGLAAVNFVAADVFLVGIGLFVNNHVVTVLVGENYGFLSFLNGVDVAGGSESEFCGFGINIVSA